MKHIMEWNECLYSIEHDDTTYILYNRCKCKSIGDYDISNFDYINHDSEIRQQLIAEYFGLIEV